MTGAGGTIGIGLLSVTRSIVTEILEPDPDQPWSNYVRGVAQQLQREGLALTGMEGVVEGNVPIASGLSSSAAMEVAALMAHGNEAPDRAAAEAALLELVAAGRAVREPIGDDALWKVSTPRRKT